MAGKGMLAARNTLNVIQTGLRLDGEDRRKCQEQGIRGTIENLSCTCSALARQRIKHLGAPQYVILEEESLLRAQRLLKFSLSSRILKNDYPSGTS